MQFYVANHPSKLWTFETMIDTIYSMWKRGTLPNPHFAPQTLVCGFHHVRSP